MRKIEYLSPSGLQKFRQGPEAFYVRYLSSYRLPDDPQTQPMSIGSAFDAYAKSYLHERLFGKGNDPVYDFNNLFVAQVESQHRDWALINGKYVFDCYKESGALTDLLLELQQAINTPRFEIEIKGVIQGYREGATLHQSGVTFLGKPDVFFINKHGCHIILDFKVNGYCSKTLKSPMAGYVRIRKDLKKTGAHRDANLFMHKGVLINSNAFLNQLDSDWAAQLCIYGWLCGCEIGDDFITAIDQLCCTPPTNPGNFPGIRIAEHRLRVEKQFQFDLFAEAQAVWDLCHGDHFFTFLSKEESQERCLLLDNQAKAFMEGGLSPEDRMFLELTRPETSKFKTPKPR